MGINLPFGRRKTLEWLEGQLDQWQSDPAAIGLSSTQIDTLTQALAAARDDFTSVQQIRSESKARTRAFHASADALHRVGSELVETIKAYAGRSGSASSVLVAAGLTGRKDPSPLPAPDKPGHLRAVLNGDGTVTIRWNGSGPTGTVYNVMRQLPGETGFTIVGQGSGRNKSITEKAMPTGTHSATYVVQAVRGDQISPPSSAISVLFSAPAVKKDTQGTQSTQSTGEKEMAA